MHGSWAKNPWNPGQTALIMLLFHIQKCRIWISLLVIFIFILGALNSHQQALTSFCFSALPLASYCPGPNIHWNGQRKAWQIILQRVTAVRSTRLATYCWSNVRGSPHRCSYERLFWHKSWKKHLLPLHLVRKRLKWVEREQTQNHSSKHLGTETKLYIYHIHANSRLWLQLALVVAPLLERHSQVSLQRQQPVTILS